jgi:hypothetical protein
VVGQGAKETITDSVAADNGTGFVATATERTAQLSISSGELLSRLNNTLTGNTANGTFTGSVPAA